MAGLLSMDLRCLLICCRLSVACTGRALHGETSSHQTSSVLASALQRYSSKLLTLLVLFAYLQVNLVGVRTFSGIYHVKSLVICRAALHRFLTDMHPQYGPRRKKKEEFCILSVGGLCRWDLVL